MTVDLSPEEARRRLVAHLGLARSLGSGAKGTRAVLERLRCIQLDPLDLIGTNADLVVIARADGVKRGDVWRHLFPKHAFEHFAKERCILPASAFPFYRQRGHGAETPWWSHGERERRVPGAVVDAVLREIEERGPITAAELTDHGRVEPLDWSGWKGTAKSTSMAIEILWTRCDIVVAGRTASGAKIYDIPDRALGQVPKPKGDFDRWAIAERVRAAGLLTRAGGSMWSMLRAARTSGIVEQMIEAGDLIEATVAKRRYLTSPEFLGSRAPKYDDRVRILGPLDPLIWDRDLVRAAFAFDYVWEVYKPAAQRTWGWYVCPLLHRDRLVGRIDARVVKNTLVVSKLWIEHDTDRELIDDALQRHAVACGADRVRSPRKTSRLPRVPRRA